MKLIALDLSLTSTGVAVVDSSTPPASWLHRTLKTPSRPKGVPETVHDLARYRAFSGPLVGLLQTHRPDILAVEVTRHAHQYKHGRHTTKGSEFLAGLYLGTARGWLVGALGLAAAYGTPTPEIVLVESSTAKAAVTGNRAARKGAVRDLLADQLATDLTAWGDDEVDALAVALAVCLERSVSVVGAVQDPPD